MHQAFLSPGLDTLLVAIPFVGMLFVGFFRLDQIIAAPKRGRTPQRPVRGYDEDGRLLMTDPDGQPWKPVRRPR